jgi:hypothetical protein
MKNFLLGTIFGLIVATVGFTGLARIADNAVDATKNKAEELAREKR